MSMLSEVLTGGIRGGTSINYAALGETVSERAGVINLGTEGSMLCGALAAYAIAAESGNVWIGVLAGAVAGGLLGAILGHQIGHGDLRGVAGIVGAIGGALTGRAIERASTRQVRYDVVLRLPDGGSQVHSYDAPPPVRVGERIRVPPVITARTSRPDSPD